MKETWIDIPDTDKRYEVSSKGRIRRINDFVDPFILKQRLTWRGYPCVSYRVQGKNYCRVVHRIVARAFVSGYKNYLQVNHKDGNKTNNSAKNLEWVTAKENTAHSWAMGIYNNRGERHFGNRFSSKDILEMRRLRKDDKLLFKDIGERFGTSRHYVAQICRGKVWRHLL